MIFIICTYCRLLHKYRMQHGGETNILYPEVFSRVNLLSPGWTDDVIKKAGKLSRPCSVFRTRSMVASLVRYCSCHETINSISLELPCNFNVLLIYGRERFFLFVESIRHCNRDPSAVFSFCHLRMWRIDHTGDLDRNNTLVCIVGALTHSAWFVFRLYRYDHYGTLCELLPAGLPSLVFCLKTLEKG